MVKTSPRFFQLPFSMWPGYFQNIGDHFFQYSNLLSLMRSTFGKIREAEIRSAITEALYSPAIQWILEKQNEINGALSKWKMIFLSVIVRLKKPEAVVETGVAHGSSSAVILEALSQNSCGTLYSVDIPLVASFGHGNSIETTIPSLDRLGWLVPESLRDRWELIIGNSVTALPPLLQRLSGIDLFLHDSLHTHEHMTKEFEIIWPALKEGGFILSDDIFLNRHAAIHEFARKKERGFKSYLQMGIIQKS